MVLRIEMLIADPAATGVRERDGPIVSAPTRGFDAHIPTSGLQGVVVEVQPATILGKRHAQ